MPAQTRILPFSALIASPYIPCICCSSSLFLSISDLLSQFLEEPARFLGSHRGVNFIVYRECGRETASAEAGYCLDCEAKVVCRRFVLGETELGAKLREYRDGFADVTCRAVANFDYKFALWFEREVLIKRCDAVYFSLAYA